ncbi:MAG: hypothetical protein CM15mP25_3410 [Gammaproteobacteria bacterium]|nr:MAG: hypothetical protein CM15mP25_3410 [Gammaproteobacteria bacterium]
MGEHSGINLLGIFGSGEVAGAIIRLDNGERQRFGGGRIDKRLDGAVVLRRPPRRTGRRLDGIPTNQ